MATNKSYLLAFLSGACGKSLAEAVIQFGTIVITDVYAENGRTQDDAKNKLTILFLISNILQFPSAIAAGNLCDKYKIYKVNFVYLILALISMILMMVNLQEMGVLFDIGFILALIVYGVNLLICKTMLARITQS